ncbi:hypothetical protein [Streptomyces sp. NPDC008092]|uniref:hypothetical protein n=1 Tax=Streptomyces sp. NPDC008092 TaxID=3364808 RepID=UPI0036E96BED
MLGIITLIYLIYQTKATEKQAQEAADQVSEARLDGIYQQLLDYDKFVSSPENKRVNWLIANPPRRLQDIKDPAERQEFLAVERWALDYFDYVYTTLPGLLNCVPKDGRLVLPGSPEERHTCDQWVAWSQTIYGNFRYDKTLCEVLKGDESTYEKKFVRAIRESRACTDGL